MFLFLCVCAQAISFGPRPAWTYEFRFKSLLSPYQNDWDEEMRFNSGFMKDKVITGMYSEHSNRHEDRRWRFYYGSAPGFYCLRKRWTYHRNSWDGQLRFICGDNQAISGIWSYHNNHREDRRWTFQCCEVQRYEISRNRVIRNLNAWDGKLNFKCANDEVLRGLESHHNNRKEDRVWTAHCGGINWGIVATGVVGNHHTTGYRNDWDQKLSVLVGDTSVFTGLISEHDNRREDRRFRIYYSNLKHGARCIDRGWSGYINSWDGRMDYRCWANGAISGLISVHDNGREDRRWKVRCCNLGNGGKYQVKSYRTQYVNNWDGGMNFRCPSNEVLVGIYSHHDNHREDRRYKFYCGRLLSGSWLPNRQAVSRSSEHHRSSYFFDKKIDEIFIIMTHNSLALPFKVGSPNQDHGLARQFRDGIRGFTLDLYNDGVNRIKTCHGGCHNAEDDIQGLMNELNKDRYDDSFIIIQLESYISRSRYYLLERWFGSKLVKNFDKNQKLGYYMERGQQVLIFTDKTARPHQGIHKSTRFIVENEYEWSDEKGVPNMNYRRGPESGMRMRVMNYFCTTFGLGSRHNTRHVNNMDIALKHIEEYKKQSYTGGKINGLIVDFYTSPSTGRGVFDVQRRMRS